MAEGEGDAEGLQAVDLTTFELDQMLELFISLLSAKAWQYMGIRLTPGKEAVEKDMVKAAMAIDCVDYLTEKIVSSLAKEEAGMLRSMVADLKINYAGFSIVNLFLNPFPDSFSNVAAKLASHAFAMANVETGFELVLSLCYFQWYFYAN